VRTAQEVPERLRRAVVRDRDHRLERLVDRELGADSLERSVLAHVLRLDRDDVVVVELARLDPSLGLHEDAELVQRGGDDLLVGLRGYSRLGGVGAGVQGPAPAGNASDSRTGGRTGAGVLAAAGRAG